MYLTLKEIKVRTEDFKVICLRSLLFLSITLISIGSSGFEMVNVPSGQLLPFWMSPVSNSKEKSNLKIEVPAFQAMKYAVTVEQYRIFLEKNPNWNSKQVSSLFADKTYLDSWSLQLKKRSSPVTNVSWFAARAFCDSQGMRLPTVNEWEYMAAASEGKKDANKDEKFLRRILDWYGEPRGEALKSVGSIYENLYGLSDMHGLIWEWVEDFNSTFVTGESREDSSFNKNMFCGAGAMSGADKENYAAFMRFAFRSSLMGNSSAWNLGFRCVK